MAPHPLLSLTPSSQALSGSAPCYLHSENRLYLAAAAKYRPASAEYSWLGTWSWGWERHRAAPAVGLTLTARGGKLWLFLGGVNKDPFRLRKLRVPRTRTPMTPSFACLAWCPLHGFLGTNSSCPCRLHGSPLAPFLQALCSGGCSSLEPGHPPYSPGI